ncbi:MAG: GNAT family N-acetyltransferase [Lachnospiraceae bacterium]|nr:GNAT family N-acetyltransferase [Lachnospiraceae bacterium]
MKNIDEKAREQFRLDTNCSAENDTGIMINESAERPGARLVDGVSSFFRAIIYKGDAYIMADPLIIDWVREKYGEYKAEWFCKFENLRVLDRKLNEYGREIMDTHVYMLPDPEFTDYEYEELPYDRYWLYDKEIAEWREKYGEDNPFYHALVFSKRQPDRIALLLTAKGDRESIAAMSGVSQDGQNLWQIGIDVLPEYRGHGLATYLTESMKKKVFETGHIPFYGTSESHSLSMDTAIRSGFIPAWCEIYVREQAEGNDKE